MGTIQNRGLWKLSIHENCAKVSIPTFSNLNNNNVFRMSRMCSFNLWHLRVIGFSQCDMIEWYDYAKSSQTYSTFIRLEWVTQRNMYNHMIWHIWLHEVTCLNIDIYIFVRILSYVRNLNQGVLGELTRKKTCKKSFNIQTTPTCDALHVLICTNRCWILISRNKKWHSD